MEKVVGRDRIFEPSLIVREYVGKGFQGKLISMLRGAGLGGLEIE